MKRGISAVISEPAETEFAAMFVPNCARAKAKEMKKTPARAPLFAPCRYCPKRSSGFQIVSPKITVEDEETITPMNDVIPKPIGIVRSWDQKASLGVLANLEKSGSFLSSDSQLRSC